MPSSADRFVQAAHAAGCPRDQLVNWLHAGVVLQERQLDASAAARLCDGDGGPTEIGMGGARGGGKSHWMLAQIAVDDCQRYAGLKCLLLRKVGRALKEGFEDLLRRALGALEHTYTSSRNRLTFPNGSSIVLGHFQRESDIDAYLGLEYDVIGVEEATTLSAAKVKAIRTCNRTSKPGWRPRMYYTTNPGGIGHAWFVAAFITPHRPTGRTTGRPQPRRSGTSIRPLAEQTGPTRFIPATVDDNRCVNADYAGQLDRLTGWQLRAWRYGDWDIAAGQFFTTFRRDVHGVPSRWRTIPKDWRVWASLDYGFIHYTSIHLHTVDGDGKRYTIDEHAARGWLVERHVDAFRALLGRWHIPISRLATIVAGGDVFNTREHGGTIAGEYKRHGMRLRRANTDRINGAGEILRLLGDVDAPTPIAPKWEIFETCPRLLDCLPALQHDPHNPEDVLKWDTDDDGLGGDDPYDDARYGMMALWKPRLTTARVDFHRGAAAPTPTAPPAQARTDAEIELLLGEL